MLRDISVVPEGAWIVAIGDNSVRKKEALELARQGKSFGVAIHSFSFVSPKAKIGEGSVVCAGAVIQADAVIGKHCIINTGASVDHDSVLQDFVHIAPGAHLCGGVNVGEGGFVGTGVCLPPGFKVHEWTLIKARKFKPTDIIGIIRD